MLLFAVALYPRPPPATVGAEGMVSEPCIAGVIVDADLADVRAPDIRLAAV